MNTRDVFTAALLEGGYPHLADLVDKRCVGRAAVALSPPKPVTEDEIRAIQRARHIAYLTTGVSIEDIMSEDEYVEWFRKHGELEEA